VRQRDKLLIRLFLSRMSFLGAVRATN